MNDYYHLKSNSLGIYQESTCYSPALGVNHAVLVVGYNSTTVNGIVMPYWIVKNRCLTRFRLYDR